MDNELLKQAQNLIDHMQSLHQKIPRKLKTLPKIIVSMNMIGWLDLAKKYESELKKTIEEYTVESKNIVDEEFRQLKESLVKRLNA